MFGDRATAERQERQVSEQPREPSTPTLTRDGDVFLLDLGDGENRFNAGFLDALEAHLDEVQAAPAPRALVTTATGKFWSNGLDLEWMAANPDQIGEFVVRLQAVLARVLVLDVPSVAALQGHTFAAGAMLALAHDERVMRADRGFFCLPEVDIHIPFSDGMSALVACRLTPQVAHEAMTTGRRYGGPEAAAAAVVGEAVAEQEVLPRAIALAASLAGKDPATLGTIKQRLYARTVAALRASDSLLDIA
jgi:Delta3-Delta2-enoyl-CoA isomerase